VNGEVLPLAEYQAELARYQAATGAELATGEAERVLQALIDRELLAQAAYAAGFALTPEQLQERIRSLEASMGGAQALQAWMALNGYTLESFARQLEREAAAAWMRDEIAAQTPTTTEQVHARQILLYNAEEAAVALARLQAGENFAALAGEFDPTTGGELGWMPRGWLFDAALEEAAFALQPGEFSAVVQTGAGYHILQVVEREAGRLLTPQARLAWQQRALADWLAAQRAESDIRLLAP
jgi:parvulin-like peptidyl-prolyl isomerase